MTFHTHMFPHYDCFVISSKSEITELQAKLQRRNRFGKTKKKRENHLPPEAIPGQQENG